MSATTPSTPTSTSANGSIQMNRRYASAPAMMPPPTSESRSIPVSVMSTELWSSRSARIRSESRRWCSAILSCQVRLVEGSGVFGCSASTKGQYAP